MCISVYKRNCDDVGDDDDANNSLQPGPHPISVNKTKKIFTHKFNTTTAIKAGKINNKKVIKTTRKTIQNNNQDVKKRMNVKSRVR